MNRISFLTLIIAVLVAGCDPYSQDEYVEQYVVEAYLSAGEPFPEIRLSKTSPIDVKYNFADVAVRDAVITVFQEDAQGNRSAVMSYTLQEPGIFTPDNVQATVQPLGKYHLEIQVPDGAAITGSTVVPDQISLSISGNSSERLVYQSENQLELEIPRTSYPGRQNIYYFTVTTLDPENAEMTPFYDDNFFRDEVYVNSSGLTLEANYEIDPVRNMLKFRLPWIGVAFYGPNRITAFVLDDAVYDYVRTRDVQQGGSTLSPGEINNVASNLTNARGVFGSFARSFVDVHIDQE